MANHTAKSPTVILRQLKEGRITSSQLTKHQRRLCVRYFMDTSPGMINHQMGEILGVDGSTISRYKKEIIQDDGWLLDTMDARSFAVDLLRTTNTCITKLLQKEKYKDAAELKMKLCEKLMEMGFLPKAPIQIKDAKGMTLWDILMAAQQEEPKELNGKLIEGPAEEKATHEGHGINGVAKILNGSAQRSEETSRD